MIWSAGKASPAIRYKMKNKKLVFVDELEKAMGDMPTPVNIVDRAEKAFWDHYEKNKKAINSLTGNQSEIFIGMKALWKLSWIRRENDK